MSFSEWKEYKLEDVTINYNSKRVPLSSKERELRQGKYPYYGAQGVIDFIDKFIFEGQYLLVAEDGANLETRNEDIARLTKNQEQFWVNNHAHILRSNENSDIRFIKYFLNKSDLSGYITGSAQPKLNKANLNSIRMVLPPFEEQKAIANTLSTLDEKIDVNIQINKTLENMAQAIFKQWFVDFEFPNEDGEPYKSSGGEMVESELGMIPKGWEVVELSNIVLENRRGFAPSYNKNDIGIPVINQRCIRNHTIIEEAIKYHDNEVKKASEDFYLKPFDVLINSMGVGTLGRVSQVSKVEQEQIVHSCITILRSNKDIIDPIILGHMIKNLESVIEVMGTGSTGQTSLKNKNLGMLKVVLPPISIQNEISLLLTKLLNRIDQNNIENKKLVHMRDALLPKLMSGEIRIPFDEAGDAS